MGSRIVVRLLGPVEVTVGGRPLIVDTRKATALLAYLTVVRGPVARDSLAALLWPEAGSTEAHGALRRTLSVLKAGLGSTGLAIDRSAVTLEPAAVFSDLWRFEDLVLDARSHDHPACRGCMEQLAEAAALVRGDFMAGFTLRGAEEYDSWQRGVGESLRRELAGVLERLARGRAGEHDLGGAIEAARRWLDQDPLHEPAHRLLMTLYGWAGETGAAVRQYRDLVALLDRELGVSPLAETTAVYEAVRDGRPAPLAEVSDPAGRRTPDHTRHGERRNGPARHLPFVGRAADLATLLGTFDAADPDGRVAVIEGPPGMGKTRLIEEVIAHQPAGAPVVSAQAHRAESGIPYAALTALVQACLTSPVARRLRSVPAAVRAEVGRIVPRVVPAGSAVSASVGPEARARLLDATTALITALLTADARPGMLILDDAHWADASSWEALGYLARRLAGRRLVLLIALRREDLEPAARATLDPLLRHPGTQVVRLGPLEARDVAELVSAAGASADVAALTLESAGLPLYVAEVLSGSPAPGLLPDGVRALFDERIDALDEVARQALTALAAFGRPTPFAMLRATCGRTDEELIDALETLESRDMVRCHASGVDAEPEYEVTHAALREVVADRTSPARRRLLHRRAADAIRAYPPRLPQLARLVLLADHERAGGREAAAAESLYEAGMLAKEQYANVEGVAHLRAALSLGHPATVEIHVLVGELLTRIGDYAGAIAALEGAASLADPARLPEIERHLALVHLRRGDRHAAASHLDAARRGLSVDDPALARVLAAQAMVRLADGDAGTAVALATQALALREADAAAAAHAHRVLGLAALQAGDPAARGHLDAGLEAAERASDPGLVIAARNALALEAAARRDAAAAELHATEGIEIARRTGDVHLEAALEGNLADTLRAAGRIEASRAHQLRAAALFAEVGGAPGELRPEIWRLSAW